MKTTTKPNDKRTTAELIDIAYSAQEEEYWRLIAILHGRGSEVEFSAAQKLANDPDPVNREIGADILGQLGWSEHTFQEESVAILIKLLSDSTDDVIASAAFSLGHRNDPSAIPHLLKHIKHPNPRVRHGITFGLSCHDENSAIEGLIILSEDSDFDVRNWATFGLGSQCDIDTIELRKALIKRTDDIEPEIRGEALIGLARRKDETIKEKIVKELSGPFYGIWAVDAAGIFPHPEYYPLLTDLLHRLDDRNKSSSANEINEAILACKKTLPK